MKPCGLCSECLYGFPNQCVDPVLSSANDKQFSSTVPDKGFWSNYGKSDTYKKCAHTHKPLKITDKITVYGGAANDPVLKTHDIYVSLDRGTDQSYDAYPWNGGKVFIYFPISDMSVPSNPGEFKKMIKWLSDQMVSGKSVHVGCIGGHGRTGMVLAALVSQITGSADAIKFVRDNYCDKAVETASQMDFLNKEFGIKVLAGSKSFGEYPVSSKKAKGGGGKASNYNSMMRGAFVGEPVCVVTPCALSGNVWGLRSLPPND